MKRLLLLLILPLWIAMSSQAQNPGIVSFGRVFADTTNSKEMKLRQWPNYLISKALNTLTAGRDSLLSYPSGNTTSRPPVPAGRYIARFNTDSMAIEIGYPDQSWKFVTSNVDNNSMRSIGGVTSAKSYVLNSYAEFRALTGNNVSASLVYRLNKSNESGDFRYNPANTTSTDDSAMVLVSGSARFERVVPDGEIQADWFGVKRDGVTDDWSNLQRAINFVIANNAKYTTLRLGPGTSISSRELIAARWTGTDYGFFTLRLIGQSTFWPTSGTGSRIVFTHKNTFGLGIQDGKGCEIRNLALQGQYVAPTGTPAVLYNLSFNGFRDVTMRDSVWSAFVLVNIDPFRRQPVDSTTGQFYPGLGWMNRGTGAGDIVSRVTGSTGIIMTDLQLANSVIGIAFSINGETRNAENMRADNIQFANMKLCISNGQDQEKNNKFTHISSWGTVHTVFASSLYGGQTPGNYYIQGVNLAGVNVRLIYYQGAGYFASYIDDMYSEDLGSLGEISTSTNFNVTNSDFNFHVPSVGSKTYPDWHVNASGGVNFSSCRFRLYGTFEPILITGGATFRDSYFERVPFYGFRNQLSLYHSKFFNCRIGQNGQTLGNDRDVVKSFSNGVRYTPLYGTFKITEAVLLDPAVGKVRATYDIDNTYPFFMTRTEAAKAVTVNTTTRKIQFTVPQADTVNWKPGNVVIYLISTNNYGIGGLVDSVYSSGLIVIRYVPMAFTNGSFFFYCTWDRTVGEDWIGDITSGSKNVTNARFGEFFAEGVKKGDVIMNGKYFGDENVIVVSVSGTTVTVNKAAVVTKTGVYLGNGVPNFEDVSGVDTLNKFVSDLPRPVTLGERSTLKYWRNGQQTILEVQTPGLLDAAAAGDSRQATWKQTFPISGGDFTEGVLIEKTTPDVINVARSRSWTDATGKINQFDYYADTTKLDANSGKTEILARKTGTSALTSAAVTAGTLGQGTVGLRANQQFREQLNVVSGIRLLTYGVNSWDFKMPAIITGAEVVNTGWTDTAVLQRRTIAMGTGVTNANPAYDYAGFLIIDTTTEGLYPFSSRIYFKVATSIANCVATPGSFYHAALGSSIVMYINTTGYAAPGTGKYRSEVFTRLSAVAGTGGQLDVQMKNIILRDVVGGYGPLGGSGGGIRNYIVRGCLIQGGITHGVVGNGVLENSVIAPGGQGAASGDIAVANYFGDASGLSSINRNNVLFDWKSFFLAHNSSPTIGPHEYVGYFNNYMFGNASYSMGGIGLVGVRYAEIKYNYLENCGSFFTGIPSVVNLEGNIFRNISDKSNIESPSATSVQFNYHNNLLVTAFPLGGVTRAAILANQTTHNLDLEHNIFHMKSLNNSGEASLVVSRLFAAAANTPTVFKYNIVIADATGGNITKVWAADQNNVAGATAGLVSNYNIYIRLAGGTFDWVVSNRFDAGAPNIFTLAEVQAVTNQEQNSLYFDLSAEPLGLKKIFIDPDLGNWQLTSGAEALAIAALTSGMKTPPAYYPTRPTIEQAYMTMLNNQYAAAPLAGWQYGAGSGGGSGASTTTTAWALNGSNTATDNTRKLGLATTHTFSLVTSNLSRVFIRYDGSVIVGPDSTGVNIGDGVLTVKPTAVTQGLLLLTGTINGDKRAVSGNVTLNQTANSQSMIAEDLTYTFSPGAFISGAPYLRRMTGSWNGNLQFYLRNLHPAGNMVLNIEGHNGGDGTLIYSDGRFYHSTGYVILTPSGTSVGVFIDKSINVRGALFQNGKLRVGDGNVPAVTLEIFGTDAFKAAIGTTAQRPTGVAGYIRANSDSTNAFEYFDGTFWRMFASQNWTMLNFVDKFSNQTGITGEKTWNNLQRYTFDLSASYDNRSFIDKGYLDTRLGDLSDVFVTEVTTTDATPVTAVTITILQNEVLSIEVNCDAPSHTAGGGYAAKKSRSFFMDASSVLSNGTLYTEHADEYLGTGLSTCTFTITNSGTDIIIRWTGQAATPITAQFTYTITRKFVAL